MRTLTRLALGVGAVSAATFLGSSLPAGAHGAPSPASAPVSPVTPGRVAGSPAIAPPTSQVTSSPLATHSSLLVTRYSAEARPIAPTPAAATSTTGGGRHRAASKGTHRRSNRGVQAAATAKHAATTSKPAARTRATGSHRAKPAAAANRTVLAKRTVPAEATVPAKAAARVKSAAPTALPAGRASTNWAGYTQSSADLGRPVNSISSSWNIARATARKRGQAEAAADWIGIGGTTSHGKGDPTLLQAGTTSMVGRSGSASSFSWVEALPAQPMTTPVALRTGDTVSVAISRTGTDRWRVQVSNATTRRSWSTSVRYHSSRASADWISERPLLGNGQLAPLPTRTATTFHNLRVNGSPAHLKPAQRITMTEGGRPIVAVSPKQNADGSITVCSDASSCGVRHR